KRRGFLFFFLLALGSSVAGTAVWYGTRTVNTIASTDKTKTPESSKGDTKDKSIAAEDNSAVVKDTKTKDYIANPTNNKASGAPTENSAGTKVAGDNIKKDGPATTQAANQMAGSQKIIPGSNAVVPAASSKHLPSQKNSSDAKPFVSISPATTPPGINHSTKNHIAATKDAISANENKSGPDQTLTLQKKQQHGTATAETDVTGADDVASATRINNKGNKYIKGSSAPTKDEKISGKDKAGAADDIAANNTDADNTKENTGSSNSSTQPFAEPLTDTTSNRKNAAHDTIASKSMAATENKDSVKPATVKAKNKSKHDRAILLGLTGGLDLSTVKFTYSSDIGYNIGFMGGYQFSKYWSVYTGVVYTKKSYKLNGTDYHPPASYFTNWVDLQTVEGYCRMLDVPLLARYTFNPSSKIVFFTSAGLSSYFMKKQAYTYSYKTGNPPWSATSAWSNDSTFNHVFSILDLSVGFQRQIGKHMNLQLEPYAKIPLGGVGFGKIKLSSFGLNLTVQYKHPVKR
ncbi:MAG: outer membrane beta-barrel protein, partial [Bacteroidota bacterium]